MTSRFTLDLRGQTTALVTGGGGGGEFPKDPLPRLLSTHRPQKGEKGRGSGGEQGERSMEGECDWGGIPILRLELDRNWIDGWSGLFMAEIWSCFDFMAAYFHVKSTEPVV